MKRKPSVFRMLYNAYGIQICVAGFCYMFCDMALKSYQPKLLSSLITFFTGDEDKITKQQAYVYAAGLFLCSLLPVIIDHHCMFFISRRVLRMKVGCTALIYDKVWMESL